MAALFSSQCPKKKPASAVHGNGLSRFGLRQPVAAGTQELS
jgi:hypothetical protein